MGKKIRWGEKKTRAREGEWSLIQSNACPGEKSRITKERKKFKSPEMMERRKMSISIRVSLLECCLLRATAHEGKTKKAS